jgi:hypothetical protein
MLRHPLLRVQAIAWHPQWSHMQVLAAATPHAVTAGVHSAVHPGDASGGTPAEPPTGAPAEPRVPPGPPSPAAPPVPLDPVAPPEPLEPAEPAAPAVPAIPAAPSAPLTPLAPLMPLVPLAPADPLTPPEPLLPPSPALPPVALMHSQVVKPLPSALQVCAPSQPRGPMHDCVLPGAHAGAVSVFEVDEQCVAQAARRISQEPRFLARRPLRIANVID